MTKITTKFGEAELREQTSSNGDKYCLYIDNNSSIATAMKSFKAENWLALLEKCKESKLEADSIVADTNKKGTIMLMAIKAEDIAFILNAIAEIKDSIKQ